MAFFPVLSFLLLLAFGSVDSWAACGNLQTVEVQCSGGHSCSICNGSFQGWLNVDYSVSGVSGANCSDAGSSGTVTLRCTSTNERYFQVESAQYARPCSGSNYGAWGIFKGRVCDGVQSSSSSEPSPGSSSGGGANPPDDPDTTYHCQNAGGPDLYNGSPFRALIYRCVGDVCEQTASLNGSCQDWGFCEDGVDDCDVPPDSGGNPPCRRSGAEFVSGNSCYYSCANGRNMRCNPVSTQYIAGATWAAQCPERPPASCFPSSSSMGGVSSSSGASSSSSGGGGLSSSSSDNGGGDSSASGSGPDYRPLLEAIKDTLHHANVQRDILQKWDIYYMPSINDVAQNTLDAARETYGINSKLTSLQENGISLTKDIKQDIDSSHVLLGEINKFLKDSVSTYYRDTTYNPLLRDIKGAIESLGALSSSSSSDSPGSSGSSLSPVAPDTAFMQWWNNYLIDNFTNNSLVGRALRAIAGDSAMTATCQAFNECLRTSASPMSCYDIPGARSCFDGGTPIDNMANVEISILSTLWNGIFGDDSTELSRSVPDTNYMPPPAADSAKNSVLSAISALFSSDSTAAILQKVNAMKDSAERLNKDSASIQPDSLWLDSAEAAQYVQNALITAPALEECFVCHAELGTLGGLAPDGLVIHVDFGNISGFNFCAIIRAVVRIIGFVVCLSLTLGSWAAAFGYNPKNDG